VQFFLIAYLKEHLLFMEKNKMNIEKIMGQIDVLVEKLIPLNIFIERLSDKFLPKVTAEAGCLGFVCYTQSWQVERCINGKKHDCWMHRDYYDGPMYYFCGNCKRTYEGQCIQQPGQTC
jgi:hypothetical protein